jgi:hypothetical protein
VGYIILPAFCSKVNPSGTLTVTMKLLKTRSGLYRRPARGLSSSQPSHLSVLIRTETGMTYTAASAVMQIKRRGELELCWHAEFRSICTHAQSTFLLSHRALARLCADPPDVRGPGHIKDGLTDMQCQCRNAILLCDGQSCSVAVHQGCYGLSSIPEGDWLCDGCVAGLDPCEHHCILCPAVGGALRSVSTMGAAVAPKGQDRRPYPLPNTSFAVLSCSDAKVWAHKPYI